MLFLTSLHMQAKGWNQFRGTTGQGHAVSENLPVRWNRGLGISWRSEITGKAWSSPIEVKNLLVISNAREDEDGKGILLEAIALDLLTGSIAWKCVIFRYDTEIKIHGKNSYASPTPFFDGSMIYFHFGNLGTACLNTRGKVMWKTKIEYSPVHGSGASPVINDDLLLLSADGADDPSIVALDKWSGALKWKARRESNAKKSFSFCTPLIIEDGGRKQIISPASDYVFSYDMRGNLLWKSHYPGGYSVVPRPVFANGIVYLSSGYDHPTLYAIRTHGHGDVTLSHLVWKTSKSAPRNSSPILVKDCLFFVSDGGILSCLDSQNGEMHWKRRLTGNFSASPLHCNGLLYFCDEMGKTYVIEAGREYALIAVNDLEEGIMASPMAIGNALYLRTKEAIWKIEKN